MDWWCKIELAKLGQRNEGNAHRECRNGWVAREDFISSFAFSKCGTNIGAEVPITFYNINECKSPIARPMWFFVDMISMYFKEYFLRYTQKGTHRVTVLQTNKQNKSTHKKVQDPSNHISGNYFFFSIVCVCVWTWSNKRREIEWERSLRRKKNQNKHKI